MTNRITFMDERQRHQPVGRSKPDTSACPPQKNDVYTSSGSESSRLVESRFFATASDDVVGGVFFWPVAQTGFISQNLWSRVSAGSPICLVLRLKQESVNAAPPPGPKLALRPRRRTHQVAPWLNKHDVRFEFQLKTTATVSESVSPGPRSRTKRRSD